MSCIKSIQRGSVSISPGTAQTISIQTIDPAKSIVLLHGTCWNDYRSSGDVCPTSSAPYVTELTATSLSIYSTKFGYYQIGGGVSWQVIEFT